ncbi:MAG: hypothetical protein JXA23_02055 [Bacteroidales bacterium]|nr:hypothetical protein [Bacteroidales bacterium]
MAPLTIFCGNNSSGKSAIAQFLLLLKQTVESYDRQRVLNLGDKSSLIDLGTYKSLAHNHVTTNNVEFSFTFDHKLDKISDVKNNRDYGPFKKINFSALVSFDQKAERIVLDTMNYRLMNSETVNFSLIRDQNNYELKSDTYKIIKRTGRPWKLPPPENFFGFPDEAVAYNQNTGFLPDLSLSIKNLIRSIYYIGPLREYPERQYQFSGEIPPHVGIKGEHVMLCQGQSCFLNNRKFICTRLSSRIWLTYLSKPSMQERTEEIPVTS